MTHTGVLPASASRRSPLPVRTSLLALLALATLLLSVLAMHSAASSHVMGFALPVATSPADTSLADTALVATPALHHESAAAYAGMAAAVMMAPPLTQSAMLDCALMVMGCVLLLVLAATVWLNRRFTLAHRLLRADKVVQAMLFAVALPIHRPRLALLGVRRV